MKNFWKLNNITIVAFIFLGSIGCFGKKNNQESREEPLSTLEEEYIPSVENQSPYKNTIEKKYHQLFPNNSFNGQLIVAQKGKILFEQNNGFHNFSTKTPITPSTPLHIASTSKTVTAMAILKLMEQGRLSLNDNIKKFFPQLPYNGINIRMLLSHRSGLPNYLYFMDEKRWSRKLKASNDDVIQFMAQYKPPIAAHPDRVFQYCNTNYVLLASIIEKITKKPFPTYIKENIFTPLGMKHSYFFSQKDIHNYVPTLFNNRPYLMDQFDCTYGDKNMYSTARDLLKWDQALYTSKIVKQTTLQKAYTPQSHEKKSSHNYALGWRTLSYPDGYKIVYHNGKWHGTNAVFTRYLQDNITVIVIGNKYNRNIYLAKQLGEVLLNGRKIGNTEN